MGEVDDAVESVVLDELERCIHLVRAEVDGGGVGGVELIAAPDVPVHDGGASQRGGGLGRGLACLDDDPEHGRVDEAQRLAHPAEVVCLRGAGARGRDDDEQLLPVGVGVVVVLQADDGEVGGDGGIVGGNGGLDVRGVGQVGEEVEEAEEGAEEEEGGEARERAAGEEEEGVRVASGGEVVVVVSWG